MNSSHTVAVEIDMVKSIVQESGLNGTEFRLLGVNHTDSMDNIKKAFRNKCLILHPDRNKNHPGAAEAFGYIKEAYNVIVAPQNESVPLKRTGGTNVYQNTMTEEYKIYNNLCASLLGQLSNDEPPNRKRSFQNLNSTNSTTTNNNTNNKETTQSIHDYFEKSAYGKVYEPVETNQGTRYRNKRFRSSTPTPISIVNEAYEDNNIKPTTNNKNDIQKNSPLTNTNSISTTQDISKNNNNNNTATLKLQVKQLQVKQLQVLNTQPKPINSNKSQHKNNNGTNTSSTPSPRDTPTNKNHPNTKNLHHHYSHLEFNFQLHQNHTPKLQLSQSHELLLQNILQTTTTTPPSPTVLPNVIWSDLQSSERHRQHQQIGINKLLDLENTTNTIQPSNFIWN